VTGRQLFTRHPLLVTVSLSGAEILRGENARKPRGLRDYELKMMFIVPTLILLIAMNIFPLLWSLGLSFYRYSAIENSILKSSLFEVGLNHQADLNSGNISEELRQEFKNNGIVLSQNATVSTEKKDSKWVIADKENEYHVKKRDKLNIIGYAKPPLKPVGTKNYSRIFTDRNTWSYFTTTAYFVLLAVSAQFIIGFGLALFLNREFKGKGIVTTLILVPMMLSPVVVGLFWRFILDSQWGLFNYILSLGPAALQRITAGSVSTWFQNIASSARNIIWLTRPRAALLSLVIIDTWMWSPFMMLLSLAGLSAIPRYLYEAAEIDRASAWFKFRHITLPLVSPLLLIALLFRTMDAFKLFDLVYIATAGGPGSATETVSMNLYRRAFQDYRTGESCALAYIILIVIIALSNIYIKYLNKAKGES
jgi:multiple sugar transport system permease protein